MRNNLKRLQSIVPSLHSCMDGIREWIIKGKKEKTGDRISLGSGTKVCYVYIFDYKNLKKVGLSIDSHYLYHYDDATKVLNISDNSNHIEHFYGENIYSLCVIAGNNGAGKSNAIRFLLSTAVEDLIDKSSCEGIVVFRDESGKLCYYSSESEVHARYKGKHIDKGELIGCQCFFYSSHAMYKLPDGMLSFGSSEILLKETSGLYNATESVRIVKDYESYLNKDALEGKRDYNEYLLAHMSQRSFKLLLFLNDYYSHTKQLKGLILPPCVLILVNSSGYNRYINSKEYRGKPYNSNIRKWNDLKNKILYDFFITSLLNKAYNNDEFTRWQPLIDSWESMVINSESENVISLWESWMRDKKQDGDLERILSVVNTINTTCSFDETYGRFSLQLKDNYNAVNSFIKKIYDAREFIAARYIDVALSFDGINEAMMSSGEEKFLFLMAELYYSHKTHVEEYDNVDAPTLYVFDEAELGYHPEWQRKFVAYLLDYFNHYGQKGIQIIMTTHSPILLSDVTMQDTVLLEKKDGKTKLAEGVKETFGTNIFELYRHSFFLKEGLVGEFAYNYIQQLLKDIEAVTPETKELLKKRVMLVGDRVVRDYLMGMLYAKDKDCLKDYYRNVLQELENEQN